MKFGPRFENVTEAACFIALFAGTVPGSREEKVLLPKVKGYSDLTDTQAEEAYTEALRFLTANDLGEEHTDG